MACPIQSGRSYDANNGKRSESAGWSCPLAGKRSLWAWPSGVAAAALDKGGNGAAWGTRAPNPELSEMRRLKHSGPNFEHSGVGKRYRQARRRKQGWSKQYKSISVLALVRARPISFLSVAKNGPKSGRGSLCPLCSKLGLASFRHVVPESSGLAARAPHSPPPASALLHDFTTTITITITITSTSTTTTTTTKYSERKVENKEVGWEQRKDSNRDNNAGQNKQNAESKASKQQARKGVATGTLASRGRKESNGSLGRSAKMQKGDWLEQAA